MGICHNCVLTLESGQVQDVRTGEIHGEPGDVVQTCVSRPATDLSLRVSPAHSRHLHIHKESAR
jgi:hypothetical protein